LIPLRVLCVAIAFAGMASAAPASELLLDAPGLRTLSPAEATARHARFRFPPGERLEYEVRYFGVPVGLAAIEVTRWLEVDGQRLAHVVATARTNDFFSRVYRIDDRTEAWIDVDRNVTLRTATHTRHGRRKEVYEEIEFDWETHFVHVFEAKRHRRRLERVSFDVGPFVHDIVDLFYAIRALPLEEGYSVKLPVYASSKVYGFQIDVEERESIATPAFGEVEALRLRPSDVLDGVPAESGSGRVWIGSGPHHVPLRAKGWFKTTESFHVGSIEAVLVAYRAAERTWAVPALAPDAVRSRLPATVDGRPHWDPPPAVREARARSGVEASKLRQSVSWQSVLSCALPVRARAQALPLPPRRSDESC
jgi:hypothetical protein